MTGHKGMAKVLQFPTNIDLAALRKALWDHHISHHYRRDDDEQLIFLMDLDYSAVKYGRLVAYRFDGESRLDANRFVWLKVLSGRDAEKKSREFYR